MKKKAIKDVRGVSNSPLTSNTDYYLDPVVRGKEVKIDWFQVTFDFIEVMQEGRNFYRLDRGSTIFRELIEILMRKESPFDLQAMEKGQFGYHHGIYIDEHIWLSYGGKLNKRDNYPITFTMSGQGCRTFEIMGGNWVKLFKYFQKYGIDDLRVGRIDIAIDDFDGNIITPYQILPYVERNEVVTQFRSVNLYKGWTLGQSSSETKGFTLTFGQRGRNQLQIYDKRLERSAMNQPDLNTDVWYRYEMRFAEEKARQVMDLYVASVDNNDSLTFMSYAKSLLLTSLDIKEVNPDIPSNKRLWKTLPAWKEFTDSLEKIDLNTKNRIDTTIEKKLDWFNTDMATTIMELYYVFDETFSTELIKIMSEGKFERKHLNRLNNFLRKMGRKELTLEKVLKDQENFSKFNLINEKNNESE